MTTEIRETTVIPATPEQVWAVIDDTSRYAEWVEVVLEVTDHHGKATVGKSYSEVSILLGPVKVRPTWTVVQADAPRRRLDTGVGYPILRNMESIFELEPVETPSGEVHTRFHYVSRYDMGLGPLGKLIDKIQAPGTRKAFRASMTALAALVAAENAAG